MFTTSGRVGVGYSYADYGQVVDTTEEAAKNIHAFLTIFFEAFPQFTGRALHLAGESYGVRPTLLLSQLKHKSHDETGSVSPRLCKRNNRSECHCTSGRQAHSQSQQRAHRKRGNRYLHVRLQCFGYCWSTDSHASDYTRAGLILNAEQRP